jgi:hypothetical protein
MNSSLEERLAKMTTAVNFLLEEGNKTRGQYYVEKFITNAEFETLMKISSATSFNWRRNRMIGYTQINGKIYYTYKDINTMLKEYNYPSK